MAAKSQSITMTILKTRRPNPERAVLTPNPKEFQKMRKGMLHLTHNHPNYLPEFTGNFIDNFLSETI
jgi:NAD(P)H-hydrate repair Nnr-like enzyme with NAD(P)H-hydrate dehydratase domain